MQRGGNPAAPWQTHEKCAFVEALTAGQCVSDALVEVGRTRASALAERGRDPLFAASWDAALDCTYELLETRLLDRVVNGVREDAEGWSHDRLEWERYNDKLAMWVLANRKDATRGDAAARCGSKTDVRSAEDARAGAPILDAKAEQARIDALLEAVARRIAAVEAGIEG